MSPRRGLGDRLRSVSGREEWEALKPRLARVEEAAEEHLVLQRRLREQVDQLHDQLRRAVRRDGHGEAGH